VLLVRVINADSQARSRPFGGDYTLSPKFDEWQLLKSVGCDFFSGIDLIFGCV
jgi:hypothetical protein